MAQRIFKYLIKWAVFYVAMVAAVWLLVTFVTMNPPSWSVLNEIMDIVFIGTLAWMIALELQAALYLLSNKIHNKLHGPLNVTFRGYSIAAPRMYT